MDLDQITPVVGDYSAFSSADDEKQNPPRPGAATTPLSAASALSRLNPVGGHSVSDGNGRFVPLPEESAVEYSRFDGEQSVYRREEVGESDEVGEVGEVDADGDGAGAVFRGRQSVRSPTSLSRQQSASVYRND